ncbi:CinA family protein [Georgenia sp. Z1491]|uniref:CinA family protein n=1 Tax=Georgenia sp. Z1491 TaxID=3416707 RepID=UPI003CE74095
MRPARDPLAPIVTALARAGLSLAVAESLTAGALAARLAAVPGVSAVLRGGVVAYASDVKTSVLDVDAGLLDHGGPVQAEVAVQMARGAGLLLGADVALATTGVAGPGPADGHAAGTFHVACARPGGVRTRTWLAAGTRAVVREAAVGAALGLLVDVVGDVGADHSTGAAG